MKCEAGVFEVTVYSSLKRLLFKMRGTNLREEGKACAFCRDFSFLFFFHHIARPP